MKISWEDYYLEILKAISLRSTCDRGRNAALIIDKNNYIVSSGYTGSPSNYPECDSNGHLYKIVDDKKHCVRTIHAEMNAIAAAARRGTALEGTTMFCTMLPCWDCAKLIVQVGIIKVVCENDYHAGERTKELFEKSGVKYKIKIEDFRKYDD